MQQQSSPSPAPASGLGEAKKQPLSAAMSSNNLPTKAAKLVPFLKKLQNLSEQCPHDIAHWSCDGKQFDIVDPARFSAIVLKEHFPNSNTKTFFRQLFYYGFTQLNIMNGGGDERTKGTFSIRHPSFLRDSPSRIFEIKRSAKAGGQTANGAGGARDENDDVSAGGEGHRVDLLEQKLSALQSMVDDLSRKLAVLQVQQKQQASPPPSFSSPPPAQPQQPQPQSALRRSARKRIHQVAEEEEESAMEVQGEETELVRLDSFGRTDSTSFSRLDTNDLFSLFKRSESLTNAFEEDGVLEETVSPSITPAPLPVSPAPVTTVASSASSNNALATQKILAAVAAACCSTQVRAAEQGSKKIVSSQQDAPMMSV